MYVLLVCLNVFIAAVSIQVSLVLLLNLYIRECSKRSYFCIVLEIR